MNRLLTSIADASGFICCCGRKDDEANSPYNSNEELEKRLANMSRLLVEYVSEE
jgi:hypothetical protein